MFPARFEPSVSASERPQTDALDRAATGIGCAGSGFGRTLSYAITQGWGLNSGLLSLFQQI